MKTLKHIIIWTIFLLTFGCINNPHSPDKNQVARQQENMIRVNKYLVGKDADVIKGFLKRHQWIMETTQSGLCFMIYEKGSYRRRGLVWACVFSYPLRNYSSLSPCRPGHPCQSAWGREPHVMNYRSDECRGFCRLSL